VLILINGISFGTLLRGAIAYKRRLVMAHTCKSCGAVADDPGHLCNPTVEKISCSHCGAIDVGAHHVCKQKLAAMKFTCESCGRVAADGSELCKPSEIS